MHRVRLIKGLLLAFLWVVCTAVDAPEEIVEVNKELGYPEQAETLPSPISDHERNQGEEEGSDSVYPSLKTGENVGDDESSNFTVISASSSSSSSSSSSYQTAYVYGASINHMTPIDADSYNEDVEDPLTNGNNSYSKSQKSSNDSEVVTSMEIQKVDDTEDNHDIEIVDSFDRYIYDQNLFNRLDRLERLVRERQDIVHSYNQLQGCEKPLQDMIKG